jgi:FkbH-like protein
MNYFVYRNFTTENLFQGFDVGFSGYNDISDTPNAKSYIWFYLPEIKIATNDIVDEIQGYKGKLELLLNQLPEDKTVIAFTICPLFFINYQNFDFRINVSISEYNHFLYNLASSRNNFKVIDFTDFNKVIDIPIFDWKYYYLSQSMISPRLNSKFSNWFKLKINSFENKRKKCLVLDLDNTLWGGILGEDGIENLKIGDTYPGLAYLHFQEAILEAVKAGIILAICSKNNEDDVVEVFEKHPFQLIKFNKVSSYRINWQDKATNIKEIAEELNIGLDSIVFIDDNPVERERVNQMLPEVTVPDFPESPYLMVKYFKNIYDQYFQAYRLTNEDLNKTSQYISNVERNVFKKAFTSVDDYLKSLEMELIIYESSKFTIPRIAQMTQKTNQFNLTSKRYTEDDINNKVLNGDLVICVAVKDKFGDNGISILSIINIENNTAFIDSFLLSCRILGRNIEVAFLNFLINLLREKKIKYLNSIYIPSNKNKQTENFFEKMNFELVNIEENGTKHYNLEITKKRKIEEYYKINFTSNE